MTPLSEVQNVMFLDTIACFLQLNLHLIYYIYIKLKKLSLRVFLTHISGT